MRCQTAISRLGSLHDHELSVRSRLGLRLHLALCRACRAYWRSYETTIALAHGAFSRDSPSD